MQDEKRNLIFISHATPEDNTFTLWLSIRLKLLGYHVWSDVTQLFGGEKWWDDIEQAVDQYTCKFVLVITKTSLSKPGVKREVELALAAEEAHKLRNFIIPIIIDDSEFGGQPFGLSERNIIPFITGWAPALSNLVQRLSRDGVVAGEVANNLGEKLAELSEPPLRLEKQPDLIVSNWLSFTDIPDRLSFYRLPTNPSNWRKQLEGSPFTWFEWGGMLISFADAEDIAQFLPRHIHVKAAPGLELSALLAREPRNHAAFLRTEVIKNMNYLLADAWGLKMRRLGLRPYELASGKLAWFFPDHKKYSGMKQFADVFGVARKKQVIGFSGKNAVHWHYAIEAKAQYGPYAKMCLIPHVVFTEDGNTPLKDKDKMHRLRRGFCKSWWNPRWRDLLLVYLNMLSEGENTIQITLGSTKTLVCAGRPEIFNSEYSLVCSAGASGENGDEIDIDVEVEA